MLTTFYPPPHDKTYLVPLFIQPPITSYFLTGPPSLTRESLVLCSSVAVAAGAGLESVGVAAKHVVGRLALQSPHRQRQSHDEEEEAQNAETWPQRSDSGAPLF